jgi:large conductance mechanosensitive channel
MSLASEFKKFVMRGNVIDMAVGIIIGGAFGKIVSSLVNDIIMPPIGLLIGGVNFGDLALTIKQATATEKAVAFNYGVFIMTVIDFLIIAFVIFMMIRVINRFTKKEEAPPEPTEKQCPECLMNIPIKAKRCAHCTSVLVK